MKIGFDAKRMFNNFTGLGNHSRTTIDILGAEYPDASFYLYTPHIEANETTAQYIGRANCHIRQPHGILKGSMWRSMALAAEARKDGIDLFHGLSNELPLGLHRAAIPSVVTIHDVAFRTFPDMYHTVDRIVYNQKWKYACHTASRIVAISQCTRHDIMKYYDVDEQRISVVYQPVNRIYYDEPPTTATTDTPYMLYVGSVNSRKNLMGVVRAMTLLPADLRMPLVVVGDGGNYKREVMGYISEHNLTPLIIWRKATDHRELQKLYSGATLFVYPSFYEGFGLPVVEASLCRCPVITSNVSSLPEAGGPHALTVDPNHPDDIAQKMQMLIGDENLRHQLGQQARRYAMQAFHPQTLARQLMNVYERCL